MLSKLNYIVTGLILTIFTSINGTISVLILLATLGYWIQKNIGIYRKNKRMKAEDLDKEGDQ